MKFCPLCSSQLTHQVIEGIERAACPELECHFVHWNNPIPVAAILVEYNNKYIIARNSRWPKGIFSVITGFIDQGETPQQAAIRETREELGLNASVKNFLGIHSFLERNQLIIAYHVEATGTLDCNHELADIKLLSTDELETYNFSPLYITQQIIQHWKKS